MASGIGAKRKTAWTIFIISAVLVIGCIGSDPEAKAPATTGAPDRAGGNVAQGDKNTLPTGTPTPFPEPIILSGNGDSVVDIEKWKGPAIAQVTYTGDGNFSVQGYDSNGEKMELLVDNPGSYQGTVPIDFMKGQSTARLEVTASGEWKIRVLPALLGIEREEIPGTIMGSGDDIMALTGGDPDLLTIDATRAEGAFTIWGYYSTKRKLLLDEIAPYQGTVVLGTDTVILVVSAKGDWTFDITTR